MPVRDVFIFQYSQKGGFVPALAPLIAPLAVDLLSKVLK